MAMIMVPTTAFFDISSSSSPAFCADQESALNPSVNASASTKKPRRNGIDAKRFRLVAAGSSLRLASMTPSGRRTATAHEAGARIMTPSMTAWPPTVAPGERLNQTSASGEVSSASGEVSLSAARPFD